MFRITQPAHQLLKPQRGNFDVQTEIDAETLSRDMQIMKDKFQKVRHSSPAGSYFGSRATLTRVGGDLLC